MIDLEKHIREQRELLDAAQPKAGHEMRFLQQLSQRPARKFNFRHALQIAASVAILMTSGLVIVKMNKSGEKRAEQPLPTSVMETDVYFASQVDERYDQIKLEVMDQIINQLHQIKAETTKEQQHESI